MAGRDLARFSQMVRNGIANPINKTVTYLTSQRHCDIYRVHVRDGMLFKDGGGGGGGGVNDCGEGGGNVDAGGGGASSSSSAAADPQQQLVPFSTDSYHTSWRVTGDGYAMMVFREAAGAPGELYAADHVTNEFHHSSIYAGRPVNFAGELRCDNGKLLELNNKSGHYKPGAAHAKQFLEWLERHGVVLSGVMFRFVDKRTIETGGRQVDAAELLRELRERALLEADEEEGGEDADGEAADALAAAPPPPSPDKIGTETSARLRSLSDRALLRPARERSRHEEAQAMLEQLRILDPTVSPDDYRQPSRSQPSEIDGCLESEGEWDLQELL